MTAVWCRRCVGVRVCVESVAAVAAVGRHRPEGLLVVVRLRAGGFLNCTRIFYCICVTVQIYANECDGDGQITGECDRVQEE